MKNLKQIQISKEVWKEAKLQSADMEISLKKFVEDLIINYIENEKTKQERNK